MYERFAESAVWIGLMLLAIDCDLHRHLQRQFASAARPPFDSQVCIVGPPALAKIAFYTYESFAESSVLIALKVLSIK
jgi:hypothetical protein